MAATVALNAASSTAATEAVVENTGTGISSAAFETFSAFAAAAATVADEGVVVSVLTASSTVYCLHLLVAC